jgi:hypothetical protein
VPNEAVGACLRKMQKAVADGNMARGNLNEGKNEKTEGKKKYEPYQFLK